MISHPTVSSHALRNHTPSDFTPDMCEITASRENTPLGARLHTLLMVDGDPDRAFHAPTTARKRTRRERRRERHIG